MRSAAILSVLVMSAALPLAYPDVLEHPQIIEIEATGYFTPLDLDLLEPPVRAAGASVINDAPANLSLGNTTVTWVVSYDAGGHDVYWQTIIVRDVTPPVFDPGAPERITLLARPGETATAVFDVPGATDAVDLEVEVSSSIAQGAELPIGTHALVFTARDDSGNEATLDMELAVDWRVQNIVLERTDEAVRATWNQLLDFASYRAELANTATGEIIQIQTVRSTTATFHGLDPNTGYTVSVSAKSSPLTASSSSTTTLDRDSEPPVLDVPADVTYEATARLTPLALGVIGIANATDDKDPYPAISNDAPTEFPLGDTVVTWIAADKSGNTATGTQVVTIRDTTKPVVYYLPYNVFAADGEYGTTVHYDPVAHDEVDVHLPVSSTHPSGYTFPIGTTEVVFTATDSSNNTETYVFPITVVDYQPDILEMPDLEIPFTKIREIPVTSNNPEKVPVFLELVDAPEFATIRDDGFGDGVITIDAEEADIGTHVIKLGADTGKRTGTANFTLTIVWADGNPPVLYQPHDFVREALGPLFIPGVFPVGAVDDVDPNPKVTNNVRWPHTAGIYNVTWTATDSSNNTSMVHQIIWYRDTIPPAFSDMPLPETYAADTKNGAVVTFDLPSAYDIVDRNVPVTSSHNSGDLFPLGNTTVTFTATDAHKNSATAHLIITVKPGMVTKTPVPLEFATVIDNFSDIDNWGHAMGSCKSTRFNNYAFMWDENKGNPAPSGKIAGSANCAYLVLQAVFDTTYLNSDKLFVGIDLKLEIEPGEDNRINSGTDGIFTAKGPKLSSKESLTSFSTYEHGESWFSIHKDISHILNDDNVIVIRLRIYDTSNNDDRINVNIDNFYLGPQPLNEIFVGGSSDPRFRDPDLNRHEYSLRHGETIDITDPVSGVADIDGLYPLMVMEGNQITYHEVHTDFEDPGVTCIDESGKSWPAFTDAAELDVDIIDMYYISYSCSGERDSYLVLRTVYVVESK